MLIIEKPNQNNTSQKPKYNAVTSAGGTNSCHVASAKIGTPATIHVLRRPNRLRVRSDSNPTAGSISTSSRRASISSAPICVRLTPSEA